MKLAFLIQAHKSFNQLEKLIYFLNKNNCDIYVHIDLKSEELYNELRKIKKKYKRLNLVKNRKNVIWSGFSQVEATLEMLKLANLQKYDYINLISGEDLLIKSLDEFKIFLKKNKGKEFIEFEDIGNKKWRLKKYSFFRENLNNRKLFFRVVDNIIRRLQPKIFERNNLQYFKKLYYGSQWFTLTGDVVEFILDFIKNNKIIEDFKYTACSDEHFFQNILLNSKYKEKCVNNNLRYIKWENKKNSPNILLLKDYEEIIESKKFIARKFDEKVDNKIINLFYEKGVKK